MCTQLIDWLKLECGIWWAFEIKTKRTYRFLLKLSTFMLSPFDLNWKAWCAFGVATKFFNIVLLSNLISRQYFAVMFYSQINRDASPLETVRCGLSCVSVQLHIPKRSRTSRSSSYSSSHSFGRTELQSAGWCIWCKTKTKNCLKYLWNTRLSVQCNFMPCLLILVLLLVSSMIFIWEQSNGYYFYHQMTLPLLYPTTPSGSNGLSSYEMHHKLSVNYPNAHVIAGIVKETSPLI